MHPDIENNLTSVESNDISNDSSPAQKDLRVNPPPLENNEIDLCDNAEWPKSLSELRKYLEPGRLNKMFDDTTKIYKAAESWEGIDPTESAITLLIALLADRFEYKKATEFQVFGRFSWLNRMNLLFYQHELRSMQNKYEKDLSLLMETPEKKTLRDTVEAYSNVPSVS